MKNAVEPSADGTINKGYYKDEDDDNGGVGAPPMLSQRSPRSMYADYVAGNRYGPTGRDLPTMRLDDPHYSSTVSMLRRTKADLEAFGADVSVLNTIVDLPVSEDVRRTVAKIFADPRKAKELSDAEWKRREQTYQRNRQKFTEKFTEQLDAQKAQVTSELSRLEQ